MEQIFQAFDRGQQIDGLVTRTEQLHDEVCTRFFLPVLSVHIVDNTA